MTQEKTCNWCHKTKPITEYYKNSKGIDGVSGHCKQCHKEYYKAYYQQKDKGNYRESTKIAMREKMRKNRAHYVGLMGGKCVKCGTTENLEIDHINPEDKTLRTSSMWSRKHDTIMEELSKCQLLCCDCHKEKTREEKDRTKGRQRNKTVTPHMKHVGNTIVGKKNV